MSLPVANPDRETQIRRLADAFDMVPRVFAGIVGVPWEELSALDAGAWTFAGGELSILWQDDVTAYFGGATSEEEAHFGGLARFTLRPLGEGDSLSYRRAATVIGLRELRDRGSALAGLAAFLNIGPSRHVAPDGDEGDVCAVLTVPFQLRIILATLHAPEDYTEILSSTTQVR